MPLANLTARQLRVYIGTDDQEWSFAARDLLPELESLGQSGIIKTFAQVTLIELLTAPESIDPRANPGRWREGNMVRVDVATDAGGWFTWGNLRLLEIPSGPTQGVATLQLGCWLAWADDPQPEGDRSEVEAGVGENSADVATRLLVASGIPESAIDLGAWDYDLPYPLQKEGNGSYVQQAGALAFANLCRQIYQDPSGIIRVAQWSNTPGTPVGTVTVGQNESLFDPTPDPVPPVERVVVSGVGYQPSTTPNRYSSSFTVTEPASNFSDTAIGTVGITTTEISEWGAPTEDKPYYWTRTETRLRQPQAATWIGSDSTQPATAIAYEEKRYDAITQILYRVEAGKIANVRTLIDATVTAAGTTITERTITDLEHDEALETLTRRTETTTVPRIQLTGDTGSTGRFVQERSRVVDTRWVEVRPDAWEERTSERVAAKNGSGRQGNIKPTALITQPPQIKPDSRPPATDRWQDPTSLKEQHFSGTALWQHPGGATGRVRTRSLTVTPGFSNEQCFEIATREVQLLEGRRESYLIELPLSDALLWLPPLSTIQVDDGTNLWTFKLDAIAWEYGLNEARLVAMGICVARVPVAVPVGVPLPEFESGLEPGQVAPEEPPAFVPPVDEVGPDVELLVAARRAGIAIDGNTPASGAIAVAARRAGIAITAEVEESGALAVEVQRAGVSISGVSPAAGTLEIAARRAGVSISGVSSVDADYAAYLARLTGSYNSTQQSALNQFFIDLKAAGLYSGIHALWIHAMQSSADGLLNIKSSSYTATNTSMTFAAGQGFTGNGSTSFINLNFNPTSVGVAQNSATYGTYIRTGADAEVYDLGGRTTSGTSNGVGLRFGTSDVVTTIHAQAFPVGRASSAVTGLQVASRTGGSTTTVYRNGSAQGANITLASAGIPNINLYLGGFNNGGGLINSSGRQYSLTGVAPGWDATQNAAFSTSVSALLTGLGAI